MTEPADTVALSRRHRTASDSVARYLASPRGRWERMSPEDKQAREMRRAALRLIGLGCAELRRQALAG